MTSRNLAIALGRTVVASLFVLGGFNKILNFETTADRMVSVGLEPVSLLLPMTILFEICGGLVVAIGRWGSGPAAFALAILTIATNLFFHDFWAMEGAIRDLELSLFFKNLAVAGGLIVLSALSEWPLIGRTDSAT